MEGSIGTDCRAWRRRWLDRKRRDLDRAGVAGGAANDAVAAEVADPDRLLACRNQEDVAGVGEEHRRVPGISKILFRYDRRKGWGLCGRLENRPWQLSAGLIIVAECEIIPVRIVGQWNPAVDLTERRCGRIFAAHGK